MTNAMYVGRKNAARKTTFIQLLDVTDKAAGLCDAVLEERRGSPGVGLFKVSPESFSQVPGSPFAYWINERIRRLFSLHGRFEQLDRIVRQGGVTGDDTRFLRLYWEIPKYESGNHACRWVPFAKGGSLSTWYADYPVVVAWDGQRGTFFGYTGLLHRPSEKPSSADHYFRPGLTWPLRASRFAPVPLPRNSIFSIRGYAILAAQDELQAITAIGNSCIFDYLFKVALGRFGFPEFVVGVLQKLPFPSMDRVEKERLTKLADRAWSLKRSLHAQKETAHAFTLPVLAQLEEGTLAACCARWAAATQQVNAELTEIQAQVDELCFALYKIEQSDRAHILSPVMRSERDSDELDRPLTLATDDVEDEGNEKVEIGKLVVELLGWIVGVAFGRFDVRLATGNRELPPEPEAFDPLPVCSPGMLTDSDGLSAKGPPEGYPISWPEDGMLVDDPGTSDVVGDRDILRRVRQVIEVVWRENAPDIERELGTLLGVRELREYLRKPLGFFEHHLKSYSKSRRKAPIYWPLSTASGAYTVWVYYPRLTADTLYKIVTEHVGPKISKVEDRIAQLDGGEAQRDSREGARAARELGELAELLGELKEMRDELLRIAKLPYKPDLNDGVPITAAPLWRLFRLPRWRSELERTWKALEREEYEWAHLAYAIWPDRVKEKCKTDKSLAIAHGLEELYEEPARAGDGEAPRRRGRRAVSGRGRGRR